MGTPPWLKKPRKPRSEQDHLRSMRQHRHNMLLGHCTLARSCIRNIADSPTATKEAVEAARKALAEIDKILPLLDYRVNLDGTVTKVKFSAREEMEQLRHAPNKPW